MADESYWTYRAATPTPTLAQAQAAGVAVGWTEQQWYSLTPGMRREIVARRAKTPVTIPEVNRCSCYAAAMLGLV